MPSWFSQSICSCPFSIKSRLMKPPPCWQAHHHVGRKMKCFPTWNEGFLPLTRHWSDCSHGPTPSQGAEEVKFFLVLRGEPEVYNDRSNDYHEYGFETWYKKTLELCLLRMHLSERLWLSPPIFTWGNNNRQKVSYIWISFGRPMYVFLQNTFFNKILIGSSLVWVVRFPQIKLHP